MAGKTPADRELRKHCLSQAIDFAYRHGGYKSDQVIRTAEKFEDYIRNGKKDDTTSD